MKTDFNLRPSVGRQLLALVFAGALLGMTPAITIAADEGISINIQAQPLANAINELSRQTGIQIFSNGELLNGKTAPAIKGKLTPQQAINQLLSGSGLIATSNAPNSYTIEKANSPAVMPEVSVSSTRERNGITEGTGSYTTGVTSTATKMNLSIKDTPQSISVVTRQRMDDQNLTSITKVLEQTPGITINRDASERFGIYSRGREITKYQFDGLTTHVENQTQNMTQNLADMSIYDKIEIVRGATGLMTGAGDVSGMINMVRKKPTREFQASITGNIGRWNDYRGQVDVSGPLTENGKVRARFVGAKQDNDTFTDYYSQKRDVLYGVAEADITDSTTVRFGIDYQKYEVDGGQGVPLFYSNGELTNFSRSTTVTSKHKNQELETTNYFFNIDQTLANDWKLTVAAGYMDVDREISNSIQMRQAGSSAVNKETGEFAVTRTNKQINPLNQKSASINMQGPFSLFGREHQAIIGYEFSRYKSHWESYGGGSNTTANLSSIHEVVSETNNDAPGIQDFYIIQRGYYGALRLNPIDRLHIILGARTSDYKFYSYWDGSAESGYGKSGEVTPYAGLVYDLTPEQSVYFSYTDIFIPNNVTDINRKVIEPQIGSNYEVGWKGEFYDGSLNANVAIYQVKRDNTTELAGYHSPDRPYYRAIDGVETKGIDLEIAGEVLPGWNVSTSYSHSRSENADGVRQRPEHPLDTVKLWNTYRFSGDLQGLTIGGGARWISKTGLYYTAFNNRIVQDDYVVVDAMARYRFNKNLSATLNITNIFDKKYYTGMGNTGYGFYGVPRNVTLGMRYDF
ncbi:TonB-dependent siderophore receptor [Methylobacillus pratensis]